MKEILIYGPIEPGRSRAFADELAQASKGRGDIHVRINSPGGDVAEGIAIYNAIRGVKARVICTIDSVAYSMASVIALAGRETRAYQTSQFMVHNPSTKAWGTAQDLQTAAGALSTSARVMTTAYAEKTGKPDAEIEALMQRTTFMTAEQAKEFGFVDTIVDGAVQPAMAASFDAQAWADFHAGRGPLPVEAVAQGGSVATVAELRATCAGAGDGFIVRALEEGWTVAEAQAHHMQVLSEQLAVVTAERDALKAQGTMRVLPTTAPGVEPLSVEGAYRDSDGDPVAAWNEAMSERIEKGMTRVKAVSDIARTCPEIRAAYLAACNG